MSRFLAPNAWAALDRKLPIPDDWSVLVERAQQQPEPRPMRLDLQQMQQQQ